MAHARLSDKFIEYGTAGFRTKAADLDHVVYRMGILAALRSKVKKATIGVMITASHNPEDDNGVKLVDPDGEMLEEKWEAVATRLANVEEDKLDTAVKDVIRQFEVDTSTASNVVFAIDTRPSGPQLSKSLLDGLKKMESNFCDYGVLTTPQLHYMVKCINSNGSYGKATEEGYYKKYTEAFLRLNSASESSGKAHLYLDGANGVGALKVREVLKAIDQCLEITLFNDGAQGKLNHLCGADYVKINQKAPTGIPVEPYVRCASFDGDADRIVYFFFDDEKKFHLLDGDKIAALVASFVVDLIDKAGLKLNVGVVQTAYANGASTNYLANVVKVPVACVPTGVKHLHHKAQEFDVGVYFEANGHGTVLFKDWISDKLREIVSSGSSDVSKQAASDLLAFIDLTNQTVGDAMSDMFLVETVLRRKHLDVSTWSGIYDDLPNRQLKVKVEDRRVIETTNAEREATKPEGLQREVDNTVSKYNKARSFVRPSGTEDVVRVYAEADTQLNADMLAYEVGCVVHRMARGVGDKPARPQ